MNTFLSVFAFVSKPKQIVRRDGDAAEHERTSCHVAPIAIISHRERVGHELQLHLRPDIIIALSTSVRRSGGCGVASVFNKNRIPSPGTWSPPVVGGIRKKFSPFSRYAFSCPRRVT